MMGIIKRADLESYTREAVPMDLGDLHRRGQAVVSAAQDEAARILKEANEERGRLIGDASEVGNSAGHQEGHAKGHAEGIESGTSQAHAQHAAELDILIENWTNTLALWESDRNDLMLHARTEVIELAAQIAARVIKRTIDLDPEVVVDQLDSILETLVTPTDIRVNVHPNDMELLERVMPAMVERCSACNHAELIGDDSLTPGSCVVSTKGGGEIDASITTQLDRIVATLLPAHRGPEYDQHLEETAEIEPDSQTDSKSKDDAA